MPYRLISNNGEEQFTTICAVSGGVDSIYMLYHRLLNTDDKITVMHLSIKRSVNGRRHEIETECFWNCINKLKELCRSFEVIDGFSVDGEYSFGWGQGPFDHEIVAFYGGLLATRLNADKFLFGRTLTEQGGESSRQIAIRSKQIFYAVARDVSCDIEWPLGDTFKDDIYDLLPAHIVPMTLACRRLIFHDDGSWEKCGECLPCHTTKAALKKRYALNDFAEAAEGFYSGKPQTIC